MIVKVCGITRKDQFNWLEQHGVAMIGLNFYSQSKRFVNKCLVDTKLASKSEKVGIFVNPEFSYLLEKIDEYSLTMVQLHGNESASFCDEVATHISTIKAFGIDDRFSFTDTEPYLNSAHYFLFDTKSNTYGGTGKKFNWHTLSRYQFHKSFLLSGGIQLGDIPKIIDLKFTALAGIDINSGFETSPGIKDLSKIYDILKLTQDDKP